MPSENTHAANTTTTHTHVVLFLAVSQASTVHFRPANKSSA